MISPLLNRQILQTASVEAVRLAAEGHALVQQEQARKQSFDAKLAEAMVDVANVEEADVLRLAEREGRGRQSGHGTGHPGEGEVPEQGLDSADGAVSHLDLLA
jgi:hypothetical protein